MKKIEYTDHLKLRLKIRKIPEIILKRFMKVQNKNFLIMQKAY